MYRLKKFYLYILLFISLLIFNIDNVFALNIKATEIKVTDLGGSVNVDDVVVNDNEITSNIEFNELNDFVTFSIKLKNYDSQKYIIDSITDNNENENIDVSYKYDNKNIDSKGNQIIYITIKYSKKLTNVKSINLNDLRISLGLIKEDGSKTNIVINPKTGDNITSFILIFIIALIVLIFALILLKRRKNKNKKNKIKTSMLLLMLIPILVGAKEKLDLDIKFTNITINGEMLPYTVTIKDVNDNITEKVVKYGDKIGELPIPVKPGYKFDKYVNTAGEEVNSESVITEDITITPEFTILTYEITYDIGDGTFDDNNPKNYTVEDEITLNNPSRKGYTFSGWTGSNGENLQTRVTIEKGTTGNLSYTANYSANENTKYKVIHKYQNMDGTYEVETENLEGATDTSVTPAFKEKEGFKNPESQTIIISADEDSEVTYIYAREKYTLNVTDRAYLDSSSASNGEYYYDSEITLKAVERAGYTFKWSDGCTDLENTFKLRKNTEITPIYIPNTNTKYTVIHKLMKLDGTTYEVKDTIVGEGTTDTSITPSTNRYEGFKSPRLQTVNVNGDGSTVVEYEYEREKYTLNVTDRTYLDRSSTSNGEYYYDAEITLKALERAGYAFKWSDGDTNLEKTFNIKGDTELSLEYSAKNNTKYTVIHKQMNVDGTEYVEKEREEKEGTTDTSVTPEVKEYTGFKSPRPQTVNINGDGSTTVVYEYVREKFILTLLDSDYIEEGDISGEYNYGKKITLTAKNRNNYSFVKWSNNDSDDEITITMESDVTLQPIYSLTSYNVVFNSNAGIGTMDDQLIECNNSVKLSKNTYSKEGYNFVEWNTSSDGTGIGYYDEEEVMNISNADNIVLYAIWAKEEYAALVNGIYYTTLQGAINSVPTDNTETTVKLLKNVSEKITIANKKNIDFDLGNFTISNPYNETVVYIYGTVKMKNGTITSDAGNGIVNVYSSGTFTITGGKLIATGTRQAIYNAGTVNISDDAYISATTNARGTVHNYANTAVLNVTGGTIISENNIAIKCDNGKLTIGVKDGVVDSNTPVIQGKNFAISSNVNFSFYDGILKSLKNGNNKPVQDESKIVDIEENSDFVYDNETINDSVYVTEYIEPVTKYMISFNPNGGQVSEDGRKITDGKVIDLLPIPTKENYYFDGWYTGITDGIRIDSNYIPTSDMTLYARWTETNPFPVVFSQSNACTFNGSNENITGSGCGDYTDSTYINTGVYLFNRENYKKDFELYFELDDYDPSVQELTKQTTLMASKAEVAQNVIVFGVVVRSNQNNILIALSTNGGSNVEISRNSQDVHSVKIRRIDGKFYYNFNNEEMSFLGDMSEFENTFDFPVTFGAALDVNKNPFRNLKGTMSNMYIKLGKYTE